MGGPPTAGAVTGIVSKDTMADNIRPIVTPGDSAREETSSDGVTRVSGVSARHTPATKIWFGKVSNAPGYRSLPHHHGEAETGGYLLSGHGRIYYGDNYAEFVDVRAGDFVFVPPFIHHIEANMSTTEGLVWLTARTPDNIVVDLPDVPDSMLKDFARA